MDEGNDYAVESLTGQHNRAAFCCGVEELDSYFHERAGQDWRNNVTTPFVLVHSPTGSVAGFYTLASTAVHLHDFPMEQARKLPRYPLVPATLLGRLAVDLNHQGKGLGEILLLDALRRSWHASRQVASFAVVVEAKNEEAVAFYKKYHFIAFEQWPKKRFMAMKTVGQLHL